MEKLFWFFTLILFLTTAHADDTAFGGSGSAPMPIEKTDIKMVDEHVVIKGQQIDKENMQGEWKVSCDFTFENTTDKDLQVSVGFPFPIYEQEGNITAPANKTVNQGDALIYNFTVTVDGESVSVTKQTIEANPEKGLHYKDAYIWQMNFTPHQIVKVHHDYSTGVTFNVMGHTLVYYVLMTGGMWQDGTIGDVKLEVIPNTPTRLCSELTKNSAEYLKPHPEGIEIVGDGSNRKYVWNLTNFQPKGDLDLCLQTGKNYVRYNIVYPLINNLGGEQINLKDMTADKLRILKNSIYAQYGRRFQDADLQNYFAKQWWYEPNANYSDSLLTKEDQQALTLISDAESQKNK